MRVEDAAEWLERGHAEYGRRAWARAREALARADEATPLGPEDLERLATSAYMLGRLDEFHRALERAHEAYVERGDPQRAVRCAFFSGMNYAVRGEVGRASGWFGRAQRLVEREGQESVARGYLLLPAAIRSEAAGDFEAAERVAAAAVDIAERFADADLLSLALHIQGHGLIKQGEVGRGVALLDEAMLHAAAGELSPIVTGVVYCGVIAGCEEAYELRRAREWTDALARWCDEQPEMLAFGGRCLAHRAEIMRLHGAWEEALEEAARARERSELTLNSAAAGDALYLQGELHRLKGDLAAAEAAFREAHAHGREPQPGLALLRLARGDAEAAAAAVRRALAEAVSALQRARLLPAHAEVALAAGADDEARAACNELAEIAERYGSAVLRASAGQVEGMLELRAGRPEAALVSLRDACRLWQELDAPYDAARTRVLIGLACRELGDADSAELELAAARTAFARLGAAPDLERVESLARREARAARHGLTPRELEVLRLVAAGKSNRQIAAALVLSEHTVARHMQNILGKLRVSSRTAAAAFAFEHDLV
jgi:DNA-binding CsgD family transcriptional regulator